MVQRKLSIIVPKKQANGSHFVIKPQNNANKINTIVAIDADI
jgi:hypothetical protein